MATLSLLAGSSLSAQVLWNNGPAVDGVGISQVRAGASIIGLGAQTVEPNLVADNFTVGASGWTVSAFNFFSYQTGANAFAFTGVSWSVVSGDINVGPTIASGSAVPTNGGLVGYRTYLGDPTPTARAIFQLDVDVTDFMLGAGDYWLRWSFSGDDDPVTGGPWQPPTSDGSAGDAHQSLGNAPFTQYVDTDQLGMELPFIIRGNGGAEVPEPSSLAMLLAGGVALMGMSRRRRGAR